MMLNGHYVCGCFGDAIELLPEVGNQATTLSLNFIFVPFICSFLPMTC
jgi:hypothetical protein